MIIINKKEKVISILTFFILALLISPFFEELLDLIVGGKFNILNTWYYLRHFDYAIFAPFLIPFYLIKNVMNSHSYFHSLVFILFFIIILLNLYLIIKSIKEVLIGEFQSVKSKYFTYLLLIIYFEIWFLIGLFICGMERL
jgi:hypothetical protein